MRMSQWSDEVTRTWDGNHGMELTSMTTDAGEAVFFAARGAPHAQQVGAKGQAGTGYDYKPRAMTD